MKVLPWSVAGDLDQRSMLHSAAIRRDSDTTVMIHFDIFRFSVQYFISQCLTSLPLLLHWMSSVLVFWHGFGVFGPPIHQKVISVGKSWNLEVK